jgi:hypothetical protein
MSYTSVMDSAKVSEDLKFQGGKKRKTKYYRKTKFNKTKKYKKTKKRRRRNKL